MAQLEALCGGGGGDCPYCPSPRLKLHKNLVSTRLVLSMPVMYFLCSFITRTVRQSCAGDSTVMFPFWSPHHTCTRMSQIHIQ